MGSLAHYIEDRDKLDLGLLSFDASLYQLLYLDKMPAHAVCSAVNDAVNIAKNRRQQKVRMKNLSMRF